MTIEVVDIDSVLKAARAVVKELEMVWADTPNKLEYLIGELADAINWEAE